MMTKSNNFFVAVAVIAFLTIVPLHPQSADSSSTWQLKATYYLEEYSFPARSGQLQFYFNTDLQRTAVIMDVAKLCQGTDQSGIFMAGGLAAGWLGVTLVSNPGLLPVLAGLGMVAEQDMIDEFQLLGSLSTLFFAMAPAMGPRNFSVGMAVPYGEAYGGAGYNDHCHGAIVPESGMFMMFFQDPFPTATLNNWVGDFWVYGETLASFQIYGIYTNPRNK